ncbi:MAG: hypothetical protein ACRCVT_02095 [Leadbetterella sp.]
MNFINALLKNNIIDSSQYVYYSSKPKSIITSIDSLFSNNKNILKYELKETPITAEHLFSDISREIHHKFFTGCALKMKVQPTNIQYEKHNSFTVSITFENLKYRLKNSSFTYFKNQADQDNIEPYFKVTEMTNFQFFNHFLLDNGSNDRLYKANFFNNPFINYYLKLDNNDYQSFREFISNELNGEIKDELCKYEWPIKKEYEINKLNQLINDARNSDFNFNTLNEEIIFYFREDIYRSCSPRSFVISILNKIPIHLKTYIEWGAESYWKHNLKPLKTVIDSLKRASNGQFNPDSFSDNLKYIHSIPYSNNRNAYISFKIDGKEYRKDWRIKAMPIGSNKEYILGNDEVQVALKDVVELVNMYLEDKNKSHRFCLIQPSEEGYDPDTVCFLNNKQCKWINANFNNFFYDKIPIKFLNME